MYEESGREREMAAGSESSDGLGATITVDLAHYATLKNERDQYHDALHDIREQIKDCLSRDAAAFATMTTEQVESWGIARHNQSHGWILDRIEDVIAQRTKITGPIAWATLNKTTRTRLLGPVHREVRRCDSFRARRLGKCGSSKACAAKSARYENETSEKMIFM